MPIQIKCPNGHSLTAKESNAGKTGRCPVCKEPVSIPVLHQTVISDSAVIDILGDAVASRKTSVGTTIAHGKKVGDKIVRRESRHGDMSASTATMAHVKLCPSCEREIDMGYHICPHCHTYITGLNDF